MWASSPMLSRPSPPCVLPQINLCFSSSTTANPSQRFSSFAVSKKFQRRSPPRNEGSIEDKNNSAAKNNTGGLGLSALTSLKSNPTAQSSASSIKTSNPKPQQQQGKSVEKEEKEFSGSDVLWALQRASAQKIKTKKQRKDYRSSSSSSSSSSSTTQTNSGRRGINRVGGEEGNVNYGDVRPICVKSEWITRLGELEKRFQELMDEVQ